MAGDMMPNGLDQWLATTGLSTSLGFIASRLHRVVRRRSFQGDTAQLS